MTKTARNGGKYRLHLFKKLPYTQLFQAMCCLCRALYDEIGGQAAALRSSYATSDYRMVVIATFASDLTNKLVMTRRQAVSCNWSKGWCEESEPSMKWILAKIRSGVPVRITAAGSVVKMSGCVTRFSISPSFGFALLFMRIQLCILLHFRILLEKKVKGSIIDWF